MTILPAADRRAYCGWSSAGPSACTTAPARRPARMVHEHRGEAALTTIAALERSVGRAALVVSLTAGILGCAFVAGSVFSLQAGLVLVSIPLGVIGVAGWTVGYLGHSRVQARRGRRVAPLLEGQYDLLHLSGEQASHLLS
ncbi:hypothetical protein [Cryobacterium sp. AP23]